MKQTINELEVNGEVYVRKDSISSNANAVSTDGMPFVMIRTYSAGVHFGYLKDRKSTLAGIEVELVNARRVYTWQGAATLSQLAMEGSSKQSQCKITMEVNSIELVAIEIIQITETAKTNLGEVKVWKE